MAGKYGRARELFGFVVVASLLAASVLPLTALGKAEKVTICHGAGLEGTTHFVTLEVAAAAVYGKAGHFHENGTPQAGHESDYLGACVEAATTSTTTETESTVPAADSTTTTVVGEETTTTVSAVEESTTTLAPEESTTTTVEETTSTTEPDEETTTTTAAVEETTTTVAPFEETTSTIEPVEETTTTTTEVADEVSALVVTASTTTVPRADPEATPNEVAGIEIVAVDAVEVLPFTGLDASLAIPGLLLLVGGGVVLFLAGTVSEATGAHASRDAGRLSLGFHRGRHE